MTHTWGMILGASWGMGHEVVRAQIRDMSLQANELRFQNVLVYCRISAQKVEGAVESEEEKECESEEEKECESEEEKECVWQRESKGERKKEGERKIHRHV